jgi:hypothetical protein
MARTSTTHPLLLDEISLANSGTLGMTFCPGKKQPNAMTGGLGPRPGYRFARHRRLGGRRHPDGGSRTPRPPGRIWARLSRRLGWLSACCRSPINGCRTAASSVHGRMPVVGSVRCMLIGRGSSCTVKRPLGCRPSPQAAHLGRRRRALSRRAARRGPSGAT